MNIFTRAATVATVRHIVFYDLQYYRAEFTTLIFLDYSLFKDIHSQIKNIYI